MDNLVTAIVCFVLFELIVIFYLAFKVAQKAKKIKRNQWTTKQKQRA